MDTVEKMGMPMAVVLTALGQPKHHQEEELQAVGVVVKAEARAKETAREKEVAVAKEKVMAVATVSTVGALTIGELSAPTNNLTSRDAVVPGRAHTAAPHRFLTILMCKVCSSNSPPFQGGR